MKPFGVGIVNIRRRYCLSRCLCRSLIAAAALAVAPGGCGFATNYVVLPTLATPRDPTLGEAVSVQVNDLRVELSGSQLGFRRSWYGAKTPDIVLRDNENLADHVANDLIAILRERGYRAFHVKKLPMDRADLAIVGDIMTFSVDMSMLVGEFEGFSVTRLRVIDGLSGRSLRDEVIRAGHRRADLIGVIKSDHQEIASGLYTEMIRKMRENLPPGLRPPR